MSSGAIEPGIAQALLKRYLNGEELPEDLLSQVQEYLQSSEEGRAQVAEQFPELAEELGVKSKGKNPLAGLLGKQKAPSSDDGDLLSEKNSFASGLLQRLRAGKVMILGGALALVLLAMTYTQPLIGSFLGEKVGTEEDSGLTTSSESEGNAAPHASAAVAAISDPEAEGETVEGEKKIASRSGSASSQALAMLRPDEVTEIEPVVQPEDPAPEPEPEVTEPVPTPAPAVASNPSPPRVTASSGRRTSSNGYGYKPDTGSVRVWAPDGKRVN
ncbi:MAG: hypothetical protein ACOCX1_05550 [Fimbriimonadaceae bacterium]